MTEVNSKQAELKTFLFTTAILIPALAVAFVGAYGFIVWIYQIFAGPPTL
ncbi:periplasmic nitrate reductase, NapE protein [Curvivirga sp.]